MAVFALLNEFVEVNSVDLSDHVKSAVLALEADALDATTMGSDGWKEMVGGLKAGTLTIEFLDDYAASEVDATMWPLFGTVTTFEVRPDAGAVGATNPKYTGSVLVVQHSLGGSVGELAAKSLTLPTSGAVARATS
jgi:hypothetical protein